MDDEMTYDDAYNSLYSDDGGGGDSSSALWDSILNAGLTVGTAYAKKELFGSQPASQQQLQAEKQVWNRQNGSGVVNWQSALRAPFDEISYLYGNPAARASAPQATAPAANGGMSGNMIVVLLVVIGLILVLIRRP